MSSCDSIRKQFSAYLDGNLTGVAMQSVAWHLDHCRDCAADFGQWRNLQHALGTLGPVRPPADLGLRIRVALSQEHARTTKNTLAGWKVKWENTVAPFLLHAGVPENRISVALLLNGLAGAFGLLAASVLIDRHLRRSMIASMVLLVVSFLMLGLLGRATMAASVSKPRTATPRPTKARASGSPT